MLDNKLLQLIRDVNLGVTSGQLGDLNSTVYLQQIRDAILGDTGIVPGSMHEIIYLQQIRNAILGVPDGQFGSMPVSVYLQEIINAANGITLNANGSLDDGIYLEQILALGVLGGDAVAPTLTIEALSAVANVVAMRITASEEVSGFEVGDITISGGSLASFATADNIVFTVSWTLAAGANTMDIAADVCTDAAGNGNAAATQYLMTYLILQPDATAGKDTFIYAAAATSNFGNDARCLIGQDGAGAARQLVQFDLTPIPAGSTILDSILSLYLASEGSVNARTMRVFRTKRAWTEGAGNPAAGATWNRYDDTNNWQAAGGFGADDCEQADIGSRAFSATETTGAFKDFSLTASKIQEMIPSGGFANNGFFIKNDTEFLDQYIFDSSKSVTAGQRPKFALVFHP